MLKSCGQEFLTTALLHGGAGAVVIKTNGQQFAVVPDDLGVAVDGHPDQTGLGFQKFQHFWPGAAHHFDLRRLDCRLSGRLLWHSWGLLLCCRRLLWCGGCGLGCRRLLGGRGLGRSRPGWL